MGIYGVDRLYKEPIIDRSRIKNRNYGRRKLSNELKIDNKPAIVLVAKTPRPIADLFNPECLGTQNYPR